ncbi:winged helix-turn-helix transcriptional regulator [Algoriphagus resistens]|uniref:winged helix-turn-helix transcriptional regulator n=1 Tax=Algoriphagus resistens TaxID=1750590 RepID=UPI0007169A91|nr:helix-turn-helix domain-containing protein [Algoriphagus resistens]
MTTSKKRSSCPVSSTLDIFGDKWSLLIIRDLIFSKSCTYGDFQKSEEKIATNILASKLKALEENGIIKKSRHPESKAKVLYQLTQKGIDLLPVLIEINLWGQKYFEVPKELEPIINAIKKDKAAFIEVQSKELMEASGL